MIVRLPIVDCERNPNPMYTKFLSRGFKDAFGVCVSFSEDTPILKRPLSIMAVDIETGGKQYRVWWDWSDFGHVKDDSLTEPCGKIELRAADANPLRQTTAQVTPYALLSELDSLRATRSTAREYDVYCVCRETNFDDRLACVRAIRAQKRWKSMAWLTPRMNRPSIPADVRGNKLPQIQNYHKQICSRVCVAPPGIGEKTWRHMETLALGVCLVCAKSDRVWLGDPTGCFVTVNRDWSDLVEKVDWLLAHDAEREEIARRGQAYWEEYLSPVALARQLFRLATGGTK
ncbi:MAG: glycosyltransferase family 1 protein [Deltaproteobacteria bacterium]|nr:glycosyltransferase family 1 protein [Deltaproteobacteria bacterium]